MNDPFTTPPREISDAIIELLAPVDVASLRAASCAEHLPVSDWQRLLQVEMPWLWELWDHAEPSFWATTPVSAIYKAKWNRDKAERHFRKQAAAVREDLPDIADAWCEDHDPLNGSYATVSPIGMLSLAQLPAEKANWCRIYYEIKTNWTELKGLQNRERIWTDVQEILQRISKYRGVNEA